MARKDAKTGQGVGRVICQKIVLYFRRALAMAGGYGSVGVGMGKVVILTMRIGPGSSVCRAGYLLRHRAASVSRGDPRHRLEAGGRRGSLTSKNRSKAE